VLQVNGGDGDALQRLIVHCHKMLRHTIGAAIDPGVRQRIDPDDVLQEAYTNAFRAIDRAAEDSVDAPAPSFENVGHFHKWLEAVALNCLRDMQAAQRRQKRDVGRELATPPATSIAESFPSLIQQLPGHDPTPSRHMARKEAVAAMLSSLARLPDEQQMVIRRRFLENVAFEQIAAELGKSREAVYMICHRGLKNLRQAFVSITTYLTHG